MAESSVKIKPFDGSTDFAIWQMKMKVIWIKEKCQKAVIRDYLAGTSAARQLVMDEQAHSEILIRLSDEVARQVMTKKTAKELWDALQEMYLDNKAEVSQSSSAKMGLNRGDGKMAKC